MGDFLAMKITTFIVSARSAESLSLKPRIDSDIIIYEKDSLSAYSISELYFVKDMGRVINIIGTYEEDIGLTWIQDNHFITLKPFLNVPCVHGLIAYWATFWAANKRIPE